MMFTVVLWDMTESMQNPDSMLLPNFFPATNDVISFDKTNLIVVNKIFRKAISPSVFWGNIVVYRNVVQL